MAKKPTSPASQSQRDKFIEAARELGCDDDPAHFDEVLKKVARHKAPEPTDAKPNQKRKQDER
jgi:hypothetical protein